MKKLFFSLSFILLGAGTVNATTNNVFSPKTEEISFVSDADEDIIYLGSAQPTMMNGIPITNNKTYDCEYTIDKDGYLHGEFTVGPHKVIMDSDEPITGPNVTNGYSVSGTITLGIIDFDFKGKVYVSVVDKSNLKFDCDVRTNTLGTQSKFSFTGEHKNK